MTTEMNQIQKCEVCNNSSLIDVLDLGLHPMCDDLVTINSDWICNEYPITISFCKICYTAHQKFQIPKADLFPKTYHYRAKFTSDVLDGMLLLVNFIKDSFCELKGKNVLDIGCNDGSLLNFFKKEGAVTYGFEPTNAALDAIENGHQIFNDYFSLTAANKFLETAPNPDVISFTNVFAHIEDLNEVIEALKLLIKKETILVIENHYLGAVFEKNQFDTFYHEHPRTYSYNSFLFIAKSLNLDILSVNFPSRYGGNVRIVMGNNEIHNAIKFNDTEILKKEANFFDLFSLMNKNINIWKDEMKTRIISEVEKNGPLKAKAFPGRAAILVKLLQLDESHIQAVYEKPGSMKIGNFLPGTRIPIKSDDELFADIKNEKIILNLAWHIDREIDSYLRSNGFNGVVLNIL
jgi:SAM-dependent methyltransferase